MSETVNVQRADLHKLVIACLRHLPDAAHPDVREALSRLDDARQEAAEAEDAAGAMPGPALGDGQFMIIAFMGHIEREGYVTEITLGGEPGYHIDLPDKLWGGNPYAWEEYSAKVLFSRCPVPEESIRVRWETERKRAEERARREAEWRRIQEQRALTASPGDGQDDEDGDEDPDYDWAERPGNFPVSSPADPF